MIALLTVWCGTGSDTILLAQTTAAQPFDDDADSDTADVMEAVRSSFRLTALQHALRIGLERKTRAQLGGPFFADYQRSLRMPQHWHDGDRWGTNYIGHPVQGAASGFIWIDNDPSAPRALGFTRDYWTSRLRAMAWSAGYSVQFEVGPFSEASIGNVGMNPRTIGWVDHVVTPTGGWLMMVGEDAIDRFVIAKLERRVGPKWVRGALRMVLNPSRTTANAAGLRAPWHRDSRPLEP